MIRVITPSETYPLRQQVLWPHKPLDFVKVPEDNTGLHFGYFADDELVSVISLFINTQKIARFRKFATLFAFQKKGFGSQLLQYTFQEAIQQGAVQIGCDARLEAAPFYQRFGMKQEGTIFYKQEIPYIRMSKLL
ncbi:MAG: GNAT family N-acetyltransferase [Spirosomataceae bacterium]